MSYGDASSNKRTRTPRSAARNRGVLKEQLLKPDRGRRILNEIPMLRILIYLSPCVLKQSRVNRRQNGVEDCRPQQWPDPFTVDAKKQKINFWTLPPVDSPWDYRHPSNCQVQGAASPDDSKGKVKNGVATSELICVNRFYVAEYLDAVSRK